MIVLLQSEISCDSISMRTELTEGLPKVKAGRAQPGQVFMNLILNGIDVMKETTDGRQLTIKSKATMVKGRESQIRTLLQGPRG
jgi:signal transduction histidine kinase